MLGLFRERRKKKRAGKAKPKGETAHGKQAGPRRKNGENTKSAEVSNFEEVLAIKEVYGGRSREGHSGRHDPNYQVM